ncbi:Uncharacterised protein [Mycobacteroides abscessus subsp. abscessus]|nr:Uncharacterised protein [Mycobacteroides abscessus subsp. abscessus]
MPGQPGVVNVAESAQSAQCRGGLVQRPAVVGAQAPGGVLGVGGVPGRAEPEPAGRGEDIGQKRPVQGEIVDEARVASTAAIVGSSTTAPVGLSVTSPIRSRRMAGPMTSPMGGSAGLRW